MISQVKIRSIKRVPQTSRYDLTVNTTHNFFANGILIHNTSGRTGLVKTNKKINWFKRFWNKYLSWTGLAFEDKYWVKVTGTRRTVQDPDFSTDMGYYGGTNFRRMIHDSLNPQKGEVLYYEIVGFTDTGVPIMPPHSIEDKDLQKQYGDKMVYKYGCSPDGTQGPKFKVLIYKILRVNEEGQYCALSWAQTKARCMELGLEHVSEIQLGVIGPTKEPAPLLFNYSQETQKKEIEQLFNYCRSLADGPDPIDPSHTREGVVVRVEHPLMHQMFKFKGFIFCSLESIKSNENLFVDPEDVS